MAIEKNGQGTRCTHNDLWFSGLQEQHLPSTIKQNFEGCNGIYEAKVSEMVECNSNDGNDNDRTSSPVEQLPMAKVSGWNKENWYILE